jgi:hypothetical protein
VSWHDKCHFPTLQSYQFRRTIHLGRPGDALADLHVRFRFFAVRWVSRLNPVSLATAVQKGIGMSDDMMSRDGLLPFRPVLFRTEHLSDDLFIAANYAIAFLASAIQIKDVHWHEIGNEESRFAAACMADAANFILKFATSAQAAIRSVSHFLTPVRPDGPFSIGDFSEENAHWVAYRVGVAARTQLWHCAGLPSNKEDLSSAILENWIPCRDSMAAWNMPDPRRIEAEIKWEARTADDCRQKTSELAQVGPEHLNLASPSAPEALELIAGGFIFRAKTHELSGRPRAMLAALLNTDNRRMTAEELREVLAIDDDAVNFPEQVVKDTAIKLRKALKRAALESGLSCENPLRSNGKGKDLTYILDMP